MSTQFNLNSSKNVNKNKPYDRKPNKSWASPAPLPEQIPSPYNFIPLSPDIITPDWASRVSCDVPFSDGISGTLEVSVVAQTDIIVGDGSPATKEFFRITPQGQFAIPGSSLKGMLRNIIEIITFSRMTYSDDKRYGVRDLNNPDNSFYTGHLTKTNQDGSFEPLVRAGWLKLDEHDNWTLTPCEYARVEQTLLEEYIGRKDLLAERQSAKKKYTQWGGKLDIMCTVEEKKSHPHNQGKRLMYAKVTHIGKGTQRGTIVFTGQPAERDGKPGKKHMEFVFLSSNNPHSYIVPDAVRKDFKFIHSKDDGSPNEEWGYWSSKLQRGEKVPIFFLGPPDKPYSMGLAMMYRLAYKHSIRQTIAHTSPAHNAVLDWQNASDAGTSLPPVKPDFAEALLGRVLGGEAFRSRVHCEPLLAAGNPSLKQPVKTVLNSPKPTYYPNYVHQNVKGNGTIEKYQTYMDDKAEIRGWKRYSSCSYDGTPPQAPTDNVAVTFRPLPKGTTFHGSINVHNLTKIELGALLWAVTFGGSEQCCHTLGMAKPIGFGRVKINITGSHLLSADGATVDLSQCRAAFVEYMNTQCHGHWQDSPQIKTLLAMADPNYQPPMKICYPVLGKGKGNNQFAEFKTKKKVLLHYLPLESKTCRPSSATSYKTGQIVDCVVLEKKTNKGAWKYRIVNGSDSDVGVLVPNSTKPIIPDIAPGKTYKMIIKVAAPNNYQFDWAD